jgi:hypothetical protein
MSIAGVGFGSKKKFYIKVDVRFFKRICYKMSCDYIEIPCDTIE